MAFVAAILAALTIAMFAGILFAPGERIISAKYHDGSTMFIYLRQFGFDQLRAGHVTLWNPHTFGGEPFMGGFQTSLFYPPNLIYLFVPLSVAMNCEIALSVFLCGLFTALWARRYGVHPLVQIFAGATAMFGGSFFLRVYAGILPVIDAMAWAPLMFLVTDELLDGPGIAWVLVGVAALTMQILAGYPQVVFDTVIACGVYGAFSLVSAAHPWRSLSWGLVVVAGALAIATVQVWPGMEAAGESLRGSGASFRFAASFSLPPENLLMLLTPKLFGNMMDLEYWGRWYLWEVCPFIGITGLAMAVHGVLIGAQRRWVWIATSILLLWIALGSNTPLFVILYHHLPGIDRLRVPSKFAFEAMLFVIMLVAAGADSLIRSPRRIRHEGLILLVLGVAVGFVAIALLFGDGYQPIAGAWRLAMSAVGASGESYLSPALYRDVEFIARARVFAGWQCMLAAATTIAVGAVMWSRDRYARLALLIPIIGTLEMFVFGHSMLANFGRSEAIPEPVRKFISENPGDYRILDIAYPANSAMAAGANDVWGYSPMATRRYSDLVRFSQGADLDDATSVLHFRGPSPILGLVRMKYLFYGYNGEANHKEMTDALPHLLLINDWIQRNGRDDVLNAIAGSVLDSIVILESAPDPPPVPGPAPGSAQIVRLGTDSMVISATVARPTLLLITDAYSRYFRATGLAGSAQKQYTVMPADWALMAIPLKSGAHLIRLEYAPPGYYVGRRISLSAVIVYLLACVTFVINWRRQSRSSDVVAPVTD